MFQNFLQRLLFSVFIIACSATVKATHIVGGVMNYKYLGNNKYEIALYVYRDCINGVPALDNPAILRIWDGVSESYRLIYKPFDDTIPQLIPDACARITTPVCVNWTCYKDTLVLPPNDFGYTIYYQRCCRNNTIQNITYNSRGGGAMDWGATYSINIPAPSNSGQNYSNNSPVFTNYPPLYICVNKPIVYDNSAFDADGDSLVYSLCTPYSGAFPNDPTNYYIEEVPPFDEVEWNSPYSIDNMLGGVPLRIDPKTGLLTGTPNTTGQFVVGICVDEYRNGILLTHTSRDFQFNVIDCNLQIVSSFFAPEIQCNNLTISFENKSSGATDYIWYFGDGDSSLVENPTHTYRDTGRYTVKLVSLNSITNTCQAEYSKVVSVQYQTINADFTTNVSACLAKNDAIQFIDKSTDILNITNWQWYFSNGDSSRQKNPILRYNGLDSIINATLTVTSSNGCTSSITKSVRLFSKAPYSINKIVTKCTNTGEAQLSLNMDGENYFSWTPTTGLNNPSAQNPTTNINSNITYYVTIKTPLSNGDTCVQLDSVQIKTINTVQINATDTLRICNDSVRLNIPLSEGQTVIWSTNSLFSPIIGRTASISIAQVVAVQKYYAKISTADCEAIDSIVVLYNDTIPAIILADNILQCTHQVNLSAEINFSDHIVWSSSPTFNPILSSEKTLSTIQTNKTEKYYIKVDFRTCSALDSIKVTVQDTLPLIVLDDSINICGGNRITINATVRRATGMVWSDKSDFSTILGTSNAITISPSVPRKTYYIKAYYRDCSVTDSIIVNYSNVTPSISLDDSLFSCSKNISITAHVNNSEAIIWSLSSDFNPILALGATLNTTQTNSYQKYYAQASTGFCFAKDSIAVRIRENATEITLDKTLYVCADSVRIHATISAYDSLKWSENLLFNDVISTEQSFTIAQIEAEKTYYLKVFYNGCEIIDSIKVFYNENIPSVSLSAPDYFCSDSVYAYAFVDTYTELEWYDSRDLTHLIGTSLTLQITQPQAEHWYFFKAISNFCSTLDSIKLINQTIKYNKPTTAVCAGKKTTIDLQVQSASDYNIIWQIGANNIQINNSSSIEITPETNQTIYFHINNASECSISDSLQVMVYPLPIVHATVDKSVIYKGEQVQLSTTPIKDYTYNWTPSDVLSSSSIYNPTATPSETTTFTVLVTDNFECHNQDTVQVTILESECSAASVYIPNAFSPNGDGVNDIFKVRVNSLKNAHLEIYDRWGHIVFESDDINDGWDGTYKNRFAPIDTYGYYFTGECLQGEKISLKGNITLLK